MLNFMSQAMGDLQRSAQEQINDLKAPPKQIPCSSDQCKNWLAVPPNIFDWTCSNPQCLKANRKEAKQCEFCQAVRPKLINPSLLCPCGTVTIVPTSNASKHLQSAGKATKAFVAQTAKSAKESYVMLKSKPQQFNCEHCNALLSVPPVAPWVCPRPECAKENKLNPASDVCEDCGVARTAPAQQVVCGVCHLVTKVPSTNFANKVKTGVSDMDRSSKKIYYDLAGKSYIVCPRCEAPLKLKEEEPRPNQQQPQQESQSQSQSQSQPQQQQQERKEGEVEGRRQGETEELVCQHCQEKVIVQRRVSAPNPPPNPYQNRSQ